MSLSNPYTQCYNQFGGLKLDYDKYFESTPSFQRFIYKKGANASQFKNMHSGRKEFLYNLYQDSMRNSGDVTTSGVDAYGVKKNPNPFGHEKGRLRAAIAASSAAKDGDRLDKIEKDIREIFEMIEPLSRTNMNKVARAFPAVENMR